MSQVVENRAQLRGIVAHVTPGARGERCSLRLHLDDATTVEGYPNLFAERIGEVIELAVNADDLGEITPGDRVQVLARLGGPDRSFALPGSLSLG